MTRNHKPDELYQHPEDDFLASYQLDHDCDWKRRLQRAKTVNVLALCVRKEYREKLRPSGVLRKPLSRSKDIAFLRTIPVEILFQIMEYLHPIDLLHLMKTDTMFRDFLDDSSSTSVWRSSFGNYPDIPKIPSNLTGYKWADLLFNPSICEKCGASPAPLIVAIYQRLCDVCLHKEFIPRFDCFKQYGSTIQHLAKHTQVIWINPSVQQDLSRLSVWVDRAELDDITSTLQGLENAIGAGFPDAKEALARYRQERHELIAISAANYSNCLAWATFHQKMLFRKARSTVPSLLANIKARFKRLGFEAADVDNAAFDTQILTNLVNTTGRLGLRKRGWAKLQSLFVPVITAATQHRLEMARRKLLEQRTDFVEGVYKECCKSHPPATWAYLPPFSAVMQFDSVSRLTNAPPDDPLVEKDVLNLLPQEVDDWTTPTMKKLVSFLPSSSSCAQKVVESTTSPDLSALNLATSVFQCHGFESMRNNNQVKICFIGRPAYDSERSHASERAGGCLIGWDGAVPHLGCRALEQGWEKGLHFSQRGHDAAQVLIRLLGLDPATTKIWEMDALDKRFICLICRPWCVGKTAHTWQDAVYHHLEMGKRNYNIHDTLSWGLVGPEAEAELKSREESEPNVRQHNWVCNHCPQHFEKRVNQAAVIEHAKEIHDISHPINNLDYVYFLVDRTYRSPICVYDREFICLRCAPTKCRLYRWEGIQAHLKDSHGLSAFVEHKDWKKINTILRTLSTSDEQKMVQ
ncbi:hypothetical protein GALMADRAFT_235114 [Galerina marginata CBS 339.88]|uniref:F-box domain-containing protein n=1 Tax=Galerina marginata (strain CBS 339.88) TaxID=685588 RepID=A0A067TS13_GALM3|nr:hypothetical protein GALMADRAFT_235114 [Galerina marginata CBS 339.88]